jgi:hypothetical protein
MTATVHKVAMTLRLGKELITLGFSCSENGLATE